jgi:hypothetical protein
MTDNEALALFAKTSTGGKGNVFTQEGWQAFDNKKHDYGKYHGKLGSMKRNNKGQSRRQADGWVKYHAWNPNEVIAYKA